MVVNGSVRKGKKNMVPFFMWNVSEPTWWADIELREAVPLGRKPLPPLTEAHFQKNKELSPATLSFSNYPLFLIFIYLLFSHMLSPLRWLSSLWRRPTETPAAPGPRWLHACFSSPLTGTTTVGKNHGFRDETGSGWWVVKCHLWWCLQLYLAVSISTLCQAQCFQ